MAALIRAAALSGYEALASSLGLKVPQQLRRVGLSAPALADPDRLIPYAAMIELLERSADAAACPDFGLRLSQRQGLGILGPVAVVVEHAATIHDAIVLASRYMYVHSPAIRLLTEPAPHARAVDLRYEIDLDAQPLRTQAVELALGLVVQCVRLLGQGRVTPLQVLLPHARKAPETAYAQALQVPCSFHQTAAAVRLRADDLARALPHDNPMMRHLAQTYIDTHFTAPHQAYSDRVRALVRQLLGTGRATTEVVAQHLALHPRTLQRRLADEGSTFELIKDDTRRALFEHMMQRPDGPALAALAAMLDYAEPSALTRSCRRWFGVPPSALRRTPGVALGCRQMPSDCRAQAWSGRA